MNRLSPLITRNYRKPHLRARGRWENVVAAAESDPLADLKLFATGWLAGLVFFGTYLS
jgi:pheromone shutdown protein TraB